MSLQLNQKMVRDALSSATNQLPALPTVLVRILQLTEDSNSGSIGEIEGLIKSDQAISSRLLRIVNSAYFGLGGKVGSVSQAVVILGFQQVRNLVLSTSLMSSFDSGGEAAKESQAKLWQHAFATASAAQLLGRRQKISAKDNELVFVGGLLQNIGSLFILSVLSRTYAALVNEAYNTGQWVVDIENERLGLNHAEIGAEILSKWELPADLVNLIGAHEGPFTEELDPTVAMIHVADRIGDLVQRGQEFNFEALHLNENAVAALGLSTEDLEKLFSDTKEKVEAALEMLAAANEAA
ncbi:MAG: HDOD domain-containing protein [Chthonomonas sp.]|nr:HDOD domain-containing protein [Chthonomonas sp.]